jgi:hypothetical protein
MDATGREDVGQEVSVLRLLRDLFQPSPISSRRFSNVPVPCFLFSETEDLACADTGVSGACRILDLPRKTKGGMDAGK